MLLNLHIKNMALIDEMDIDFGNYLNILTGETGAGKSIVIDSIMLALGGKVPKDFVRKDADYGLVELIFSVGEPDIINKLKEYDIPDLEEEQLILSRKIIGNRSVSKINGETTTITRVREIASLLLDLHAQHEHQSLLIPGNHIKLLDRYGHEKVDAIKLQVSQVYHQYKEILNEIETNSINEDEKARQLDLLLFEKQEIEDAALRIGEDDELEEQYQIAANSRNIAESIMSASQHIDNIAADAVDRAIRDLSSSAELDKNVGSMYDILATVSDLMSDFSRESKNYLSDNIYSEEDFVRMENRLNQINHLKAKYGKNMEDIFDYLKHLEDQHDKLVNHELYLEEKRKELESVKEQLDNLCMKLSKARKNIAKELTKQIKEALVDLNFLEVSFDMEFEHTKDYSAEGYDTAFFVISTNVGEEMKPLWQVASGGELSRIMLAMKSCLADADRIETLIFDEIDVGISGRTAQMVAEKISGIGLKHQVICITHLPQIAAMANHHYLIEKNVAGDKTITNITKLNKDQEVMELARLIGGVKITDTVIESAKEMKELANKAKVN